VAAYSDVFVSLAEREPERVLGAFVTGNIFDTLGTQPMLGRGFGAADDEPGAALTAVLGPGLWQRQFGGDRTIVGREIRVSGRPVTVIGVMPPGFRLPLDYRESRSTEIFIPAQFDSSRELPWGNRSYFIVARMAPEANAAAVGADISRTHASWVEQGLIDANDAPRDRVAFPIDRLLFQHVERALLLLFGAVGLLLLIACTNVAHLLLARGDARRRELATQAVLGASRGRIATHLLAESGVLAVLGGALGIGIGWLIIQATTTWAPINAIRTSGVEMNAQVLAFTAGVALLATLVAGVLPAVSLSRARPGEALAGARAVTGGPRRGLRRALVTAEIALSLVLVLCAALLARSYAGLRSIDLGFATDRVVTLRVDLPPAEYQADGRTNRFFREVLDRLRAVPGVEAAGAVRVLPLSNTIGDFTITVEHRPDLDPNTTHGDWQVVTPGYFEALGMRLRHGRTLQPGDDETAPTVAVVSETMAERHWPRENAIGRRFHLGTQNQPWIEIVGVAETIRHNAVIEEPRAEMYIPHAQWSRATGGGSPRYGMTLVARTAGDPSAVLPRLREEIRAVDPRLPVSDARTMDAIAADALAEPRFTTYLLSGFAALALLLAAIGLYGVVAFTTARRTREIGVRMALGARPAGVCLLVIRDSVALAAAGVAVGLVGSFWATRLLADRLYGISALDPATFVLAPVALLFRSWSTRPMCAV
jgi:predicted permease